MRPQARLTKTFLEALRDPHKPLTTHYGALLGLRLFGPHTVHMLLMPMMPAYLEQLNGVLHPSKPDAAGSKKERLQDKQALVLL